MFSYTLGEIQFPQKGERIEIGVIYEGGEKVSAVNLETDGRESWLDTQFVDWTINDGQPEKPVDETAVLEAFYKMFRFIEQNADRFSRHAAV